MLKDPLIYILILNWNGKEDTLACLTSVRELEYAPFQVVVIDNGSEDGSFPILVEKFPEVIFLQNGANLGYARGNNAGIFYALHQGAEAILLLNNDTIVSKDLLTKLALAAIQHPKGGIFGVKSLHFYQEDKIDRFGELWYPEAAQFFSPYQNRSSLGPISSFCVDAVCGCCILIRREVFDQIGFLDPRFFLLWEESDFCLRAKKKGFEIWAISDAIIWHKVSASFSGKPLMHYYWWRNRLLFIYKNFSRKERYRLYQKVIWKEAFKECRHYFLKSLEAFFFQKFSPKKLTLSKKKKLQKYRAGCLGIWDYLRGKFEGPIPPVF